jgi:hypothetical protein
LFREICRDPHVIIELRKNGLFMGNDWRITNQHDYLDKALLRHIDYYLWSENWDHDHCDFCWDKFSLNDPGAQKRGYCTVDGYTWICNRCYHDFKDEFSWIVLPD